VRLSEKKTEVKRQCQTVICHRCARRGGSTTFHRTPARRLLYTSETQGLAMNALIPSGREQKAAHDSQTPKRYSDPGPTAQRFLLRDCHCFTMNWTLSFSVALRSALKFHTTGLQYQSEWNTMQHAKSRWKQRQADSQGGSWFARRLLAATHLVAARSLPPLPLSLPLSGSLWGKKRKRKRKKNGSENLLRETLKTETNSAKKK
jgi:hypothetical protein